MEGQGSQVSVTYCRLFCFSQAAIISLVTTFKKGYPNGGAELHNMLSKEIIWSGHFINGALADTAHIDDDTRNCSIANISASDIY